MPNVIAYQRRDAVAYAQKWAYSRNPRYMDFSNYGGDCTNFISQCLYAGSKIQNYTPVFGWYYRSASDRTPSWTGVQYLYNFLISNKTRAVFASETDISKMQIGDVIQLGNGSGRFYHSLLAVKVDQPITTDSIYIATHTFDTYMRPLGSYLFDKARFLHIEGVYV